MQFKQKPLTLVCYICGREFGTKSLQIHIKTCRQKFQQVQNLKQKKDRITIPEQPQYLSEILNGNLNNIEKYNEVATQIHKYNVLPACKYCKRTFNQQSLKVHQKVCPNKTNSFGKIDKGQNNQIKDDLIKKPRTLICCVCGREFGLASLKIHYPQCILKFKNEQKQKPVDQRRQASVFSQQQLSQLNNKVDWTFQQIQSFNNKASSHFKDKGMMHCANCKRSFMPDPYQRHLKNCKLINGNHTVVQQKSKQITAKKLQQQQIKKPRTLVCCVCGREFGLLSLKIHYPQCLNKFKNEQKLKAKEERREPQIFNSEQLEIINTKEEWTIQEIQNFNKRASLGFRDKGMIHCSNCKRSFMPDPFQKHLKNCKLINGTNIIEQAVLKQENKADEQLKKPRVLICHICGRQFGLSSLLIHQKACKITFLNNQKLKSKSQQRQLPIIPIPILNKFDFKLIENWSIESIEEYNKMANDIYRNESMYECAFCQRKFKQQSYDKHIKYCQKHHKKQGQQIQKISKTEHLVIPKKDNNQDDKRKKIEQQKVIYKQIPINHIKQQLQQINKNLSKVQQQPAQLQQTTQITAIKWKKQQFLNKINNINDIQNHSFMKIDRIQENIQYITDKPLFNETQNQDNSIQSNRKKENSVKSSKDIDMHERKLIDVSQTNKDLSIEDSPLQMCKQCGRKFVPQRLIKHQSICKGIKKTINLPLKKFIKQETISVNLDEQKKQIIIEKQQKQQENAAFGHSKLLMPCRKCGRKFLQNRLERHEGCCKGKLATISTQNKQDKKIGKMNKQNNNQNARQQNTNPIQTNYHVEQKGYTNQITNVPNNEQNNHKIQNRLEQQTIQAQQLTSCQKCGRKFNKDRLQIHQNVCKGLQKREKTIKQKLKEEQNMKKAEIVRKTKQNFFKMAEQLKAKKVKQEQIDSQLQKQLEKLSISQNKTPRIFKAKGLNNEKADDLIINKIQKKQPLNHKVQGISEIQHVSKWSKNKFQNNKNLKIQVKNEKKMNHLPKI